MLLAVAGDVAVLHCSDQCSSHKCSAAMEGIPALLQMLMTWFTGMVLQNILIASLELSRSEKWCRMTRCTSEPAIQPLMFVVILQVWCNIFHNSST
eukprot:4034217-Amphidinium_carterae.2